jgi:hypothetical protein
MTHTNSFKALALKLLVLTLFVHLLFSQSVNQNEPNFIDLVSKPTWQEYRVEAGKVKKFLDPNSISRIVIIYSNSSMEIRTVAKALQGYLQNADEFIPPPKQDKSPVWKAIIYTNDGKYLYLQVSGDQLFLIGESFSGYFKTSNVHPK